MWKPGRCPYCDGIIKVDNTKETAVCEHCSTPFFSEQAINNYFTQNNTYIQNATIVNKDSAETFLEKGIKQLELKKYGDAIDTFTKMSKEYPENWKSWYGIAVARGFCLPSFTLDVKKEELLDAPESVLNDLSPENAPIELPEILQLEEETSKLKKDIDSSRSSIDSKSQMVEKYIISKTKTRVSLISRWLWLIVAILAVVIFLLLTIKLTQIKYAIFTGIALIVSIILIIVIFQKKGSNTLSLIKHDIKEYDKEIGQLVSNNNSNTQKYNELYNRLNVLKMSLNSKLENSGVSTVSEYYLNILKR